MEEARVSRATSTYKTRAQTNGSGLLLVALAECQVCGASLWSQEEPNWARSNWHYLMILGLVWLYLRRSWFGPIVVWIESAGVLLRHHQQPATAGEQTGPPF